MNNFITIKGAKEHNLKSINLKIPKNQLVVISGLSGSGKSTLAFDTIYAEGQRKYILSLSSYARQFLNVLKKPNVDVIEGLSPAISIEQKNTSNNPRSTVATVTEIYDYLRLLFARIGIAYSPTTGKPITAMSVQQITTTIMKQQDGEKFYILAPIIRKKKGSHKEMLTGLIKKGYHRFIIDGEMRRIESFVPLNKNKQHDISVIVDRLIMTKNLGTRISASCELALELADGLLVLHSLKDKKEKLFSQKHICPVSGFSIAEIEPRLFSFNTPLGACHHCNGLGVTQEFDINKIIVNKKLSIVNGAIAVHPFNFHNPQSYYSQVILSLLKHLNVNSLISYEKFSPKVKQALLYGTKDAIEIIYMKKGRTVHVTKEFEGVIPHLIRRSRQTSSSFIREYFSKFKEDKVCEVCHGFRLNQQALAVKIHNKHIAQVSDMTIEQLPSFLKKVNEKLSVKDTTIASPIFKEVFSRLKFLLDVGLGYLNLSRMAGSLSGGEAQRIRLASQIGSGLTGVIYVLDEPSIGLHQRDNNKLIHTLKYLRDLGNTVFVVEHDEETIMSSDFLIDIGPKAGIKGGKVMVAAPLKKALQNKNSLTVKYLTGAKTIKIPNKPKKSSQFFSIKGVNTNNLKNIDVDIPTSLFTCVTGVSGSGKSSLIIDSLYPALANRLMRSNLSEGKFHEITNIDLLDKIIEINQKPIGRTPRSNPATYTGVFTLIRELFAGLPESKARGYREGRFSFNVKGGRCEICKGDGLIKIEMLFLADVYVKCDKCEGSRYNNDTLEIKYKDKNIADILDMDIDTSLEFFKNIPKLNKKLLTIKKVGLGYIKLGQAATTLSGGEAQRIKLSKELSKTGTGKTLYIMDEPTTGLHFEDIKKLLNIIYELRDKGNTVLVIEHNLDMIKVADWVIDIGPEAGSAGGNIVGYGTPRDISNLKNSYTGLFLKDKLKKV